MCCGANMELLIEKTEDAGKEKHVPVIEKTDFGFRIKVGEIDHPMEEGHFIEWIEINPESGKSGKKFLKPGNEPVVDFYIKEEKVTARAYCNMHGLWTSK